MEATKSMGRSSTGVPRNSGDEGKCARAIHHAGVGAAEVSLAHKTIAEGGKRSAALFEGVNGEQADSCCKGETQEVGRPYETVGLMQASEA